MWHIHSAEYFSVVKSNKLLIHGMTEINLKCIMLNKSDSKDCILYGSIYMTSGKDKIMGTEIRLVVGDKKLEDYYKEAQGILYIVYFHCGLNTICLSQIS